MVKLQQELLTVLAKLAEASGVEMPEGALEPQVPFHHLDTNDIILRVDVRAYSHRGEEFRVCGLNTMPHVLSPEMHLEAARNFEELFHSTVTRPSLNRFNTYLSKYTKQATHDDDPAPVFKSLPVRGTSEDSGYLSDAE